MSHSFAMLPKLDGRRVVVEKARPLIGGGNPSGNDWKFTVDSNGAWVFACHIKGVEYTIIVFKATSINSKMATNLAGEFRNNDTVYPIFGIIRNTHLRMDCKELDHFYLMANIV